MFRNLCLQEVDELWLHERVVVGDAKADDALAAQLCSEVVGELALVLLLHDEDDVSPLNQLGRERVVGTAIRAGRSSFETGPVGEYLPGSGAAEAVLAADEEEAQG